MTRAIFFLILGLFFAGLVRADQLTSRATCASLLSSSPFTRLDNGSEVGNWSKAYLNLLDLVIEGLDKIDDHAFGHVDRMQVKTQLLLALASSEAPLNPIDELNSPCSATSRNFTSLVNFSPKLSTLAESGQFAVVTENLTPEDWANIRQAIKQKLAQQQIIQKEQGIARPATRDDFLDLPDEKSETRLFQLIRQESFSEAQQLVENPLMTPRYINQLSKVKLTALDTLNDYYKYSYFNQYEFRLQVQALKRSMVHHKAKTSEELTELNKKVIEAAKINDTAAIQKAYDEGLNLFFDNLTVKNGTILSPKVLRIFSLVKTYTDTPLHWAVRNGHLEATELLIKLGSNVDALGDQKFTPLLVAILDRAPLAIVKALLAAHPNVEIPVTSGATVLLWAIKSGRHDVVKLLLEHGARIDARDVKGNGAFHWLTENFDTEMIPLFVKYGLDINQTNNDKETALHQACQQFEVIDDRLIPELIAHGADPTLKDSRGYTPYYWTSNIVDSKTKRAVRAELRRYLPSRREQLQTQAKDIWNKLRSTFSRGGKP